MAEVLCRCLGALLCIAACGAGTMPSQIPQIEQALRARQFDTALRLLQPELAHRPGDFRLWTLRGYALDGAGRRTDSLAAYRRALQLQPAYMPALQGAAQLEYALGDPECRKTLTRIIALDPGNQTAHGMMAVLAVESGDCASAVRSFEKAPEALQHNSRGLWQYANCLFALHRHADAAAAFRRLLLLRPGDNAAQYNLAVCLFGSGRQAEAVGILQQLAARERPDADVLTLLASATDSAGRTADALAVLLRAAELYPEHEGVYVELVALYLRHDSVGTAAQILDAAERRIPTSARLAALRGLILAETNRLDEAQAAFERASRMSPSADFARLGLGMALLASDQPEKSVAVLREEWRRHPDRAESNFFLARALLARAPEPADPDFREAVGLLERASRINPAVAEVHGALGKAYLAQRRDEDAAREFRRALDLNPSDKAALYQLMLLYARAGKDSEAAPLKQRMRELLRYEPGPIRPAPEILPVK